MIRELWLADCIFSGAAAQKAEKRAELCDKCSKDKGYCRWLIAGPLQKFKMADVKEKRAMSESVLVREIKRTSTSGMEMRRINGCFMPQDIYE